MTAYDLTRNAFALLGISPRATRQQIGDAYQDALLDIDEGGDEVALDRAQQVLFAPRERLEAELGFFIETKPATARAIVAGLRRGASDTLISGISGLDRANVLAHLCAIGSPNERLARVRALVEAYDDVEPRSILDAVAATRSVSGFGPVDPETLQSSLRRLTDGHASAAVDAVMASSGPGPAMSELVAMMVDASRERREFIEAAVRCYEAEVAGELEAGASRVEEALDAISAHPESQHALAVFESELRAWDDLAQPLQVADHYRGIDERRSRDLFASIRKVCLSLANQNGQYNAALAVAKIAAAVFAELPDAAEMLAEDIATLEELVADARRLALLQPLLAAIEVADDSHSQTGKAIRRGGFGASAVPPIKAVAEAYLCLVNGLVASDVLEHATRAVRGLAVSLSNNSDDSESALAIVTWLLSFRAKQPADVVRTLEEDRTTAQRNIDFGKLLKAVEDGRLGDAEDIAARLRSGANDEMLETLEAISNVVRDRKASRKSKWVGWGIAAVIMLGLIAAEDDHSSSNAENTFNATDWAVYDVTASADAPTDTSLSGKRVTASANEEADDGSEAQPASGQVNPVLSLPELRYCRKQNARLTAVENVEMTEIQISRFNAAVDDYNGRCGAFRYDPSDRTIVEGEVASSQWKLAEEGRAIIGKESE